MTPRVRQGVARQLSITENWRGTTREKTEGSLDDLKNRKGGEEKTRRRAGCNKGGNGGGPFKEFGDNGAKTEKKIDSH